MIKLYKKDSKGHVRIWTCDIVDYNLLKIEYGVQDGEMQTKLERVTLNQSGRSIDEQMLLRANSRAKSKMQQGYKTEIKDALELRGTNQINLKMPMLAKEYNKDKHKKHLENAYFQYKYDGNRCLIHNTGENIIAYTRNGKPINNIEHILDEIYIPEGMTLDGELYSHNMPLQMIVSCVKRKQEMTKHIKYVIYDTISDEKFSDRYASIFTIPEGENHLVAPTYKLHDHRLVDVELASARQKGYEGLIMRIDDRGYEVGKRSESLLKIKEWNDGYFEIIDIEMSVDNWAILICAINGKFFRVSCPGNMEERTKVLKHKYHYIGKKARVEYAYLTQDGIPFHPVATLIE